jgi:hypothetical protein
MRAADRAWGWLAWAHRWAGVALCLLFAVWFASGAILLFVPYPSLGETARWDSGTPADMTRLAIGPGQALTARPDATALRLIGLAGRPVYVLSKGGEPDRVVAGDSGAVLSELAPEAARSIAEAFRNMPADAVAGPLAYDQWTVPNGLDAARPYYRVSFADPEGTTLYISARTGEALQRTTASARFWNYLGSVLHWIYFTPIRRSWSLWDQLVWWLSLAATGLTAAGFVLGIYRTANARGRGLSPFRKWMRWHHIVGLFAGVFVFTWILSGWLSMDHGRLFSTGEASAGQMARMAGRSLAQTADAVPLDFLRGLEAPMEIRFGAVASEPVVMVARQAAPPVIYTGESGAMTAHDAVPAPLLLAGIHAVWPDAAMTEAGIAPGDDFYVMAEEMAGGLALFASHAGPKREVYVDTRTGRIAKVMDGSRRAYAWWYYALHTLRAPSFTGDGAVHASLVLLLLAAGFAFSVTGVVIAVKRLARDLLPRPVNR